MKTGISSSTVGFAREIPSKIKSAPEQSGGAVICQQRVFSKFGRNPGYELVVDPANRGMRPGLMAKAFLPD